MSTDTGLPENIMHRMSLAFIYGLFCLFHSTRNALNQKRTVTNITIIIIFIRFSIIYDKNATDNPHAHGRSSENHLIWI